MKVSSQFAVVALASLATAASVDVHKRETPLSVKLAASGNSEVKVTLTNNGEKTLNLLSKGTFLDEELPVEKVQMYAAGGSKFNRSPSHSYLDKRGVDHRKASDFTRLSSIQLIGPQVTRLLSRE